MNVLRLSMELIAVANYLVLPLDNVNDFKQKKTVAHQIEFINVSCH